MSKELKIEPLEPSICFRGSENIEIMRIEPNGDIFVHGRLAVNDKEVVEALRNFLLNRS